MEVPTAFALGYDLPSLRDYFNRRLIYIWKIYADSSFFEMEKVLFF
jgi:hypothetical protein